MKILTYTAGDAESHKALGKKLQELKEGDYVITIKRNRPVRSLSHNRYYHLILNIIGLSTGHTHEELHEAMKLKFNSEIIHFPKGGSQIIGKTTTDMDSAAFQAFINRVKQWALDEYAIVIPDKEKVNTATEMDIQNAYDETQTVY